MVWKEDEPRGPDYTVDSSKRNGTGDSSDSEEEETAERRFSDDNLEGFPYVKSAFPIPRHPTRVPGLRSRLKSFKVSALKGIPEEISARGSSRPTSPAFVVGTKRSGRSLDQKVDRQHKRQKEGNKAEETITVLTLDDIRYENQQISPVFGFEPDLGWFLHNLPTSATTAGSSSPVWPSTDSSTTEFNSASSVTSTGSDIHQYDGQMSHSKSQIQPIDASMDPVIEPSRLQRILAGMGVDWPPDVISRCLRKDVVFRTSSPPAEGSLPAEAYSAEHIKKVKAFAEFLFASSILDDAFPLFLQVWIKRRGDAGYMGLKALMQCARSAVREDDLDLIRSLLEQELSLLHENSPRSDLIRSLVRLELSRISLREGNKSACNLLHYKAMYICPSQTFFLNLFDTARQRLHENIGPDPLIRDILGEVFQLTDSDQYYETLTRYEENEAEGYILHDVQLAVIYLAQHQAPSEACSGALHLRACLDHAIRILQRDSWWSVHHMLLGNIDTHWPGCPRNAELAVFFQLLKNWSTLPYPCEGLELEHENAFNSMSTLQVISVIAFLALDGNNIPGACNVDLPQGAGDRVSALLELEDDTLLMGFLWCFLELSRKRASKRLDLTTFTDIYTHLVVYLFKSFGSRENDHSDPLEQGDRRIRESVMTEASADPTIATTLSTSSTLSSMRRQSRMSNASSITRWSNRTLTADDLVEQSSMLAISDGAHSQSVQETTTFTPVGEESNTLPSILIHSVDPSAF